VYEYVLSTGANSKGGLEMMKRGIFKRQISAMNAFAAAFPPGAERELTLPDPNDLAADRARRCTTVEQEEAYDAVVQAYQMMNPAMSGIYPAPSAG